jgi:hypothetical protein
MANFFTVIPLGESIPRTTDVAAYLLTDRWDDWFEYSTMYTLKVRDSSGVVHRIGSVKIGQVGMQPEQRRVDFPEFSRHSIMSKLNWRVVNERYKIYS